MYPKIFTELFREFHREPKVFVGMPFSNDFESRWKLIFEPAILSCGLKPYRLKERFVSDSIPVDILQGLSNAKLLLFDISNEKTERPNPNVMYELGIAHATRLAEEVIILRDEQSENIPFDIKHIRWNKFLPAKVHQSKSKIKHLIRNAEKEINITKDSMVKKVLNSLDPDMIEFLEVVRHYAAIGFDLSPFDPDRKGLHGLVTKDCSENYLRQIARHLIGLEIIKSARTLPPKKRIYGGTPEYYLTELGKAVLTQIPAFSRKK